MIATPTYDSSMSAGEDFARHFAACPDCTAHRLCRVGSALEQAIDGSDETAADYAHRARVALLRRVQ